MRVVLDTNVLISAVFFAGPPSRILAAWLEDEFELVVSAEILQEYRTTANRIGEKFPEIDLGPLLDRIALHAILVVPVPLPDDACGDRDDVSSWSALCRPEPVALFPVIERCFERRATAGSRS